MHRIKWNEDSKKMAKDDGWCINIFYTDLQKMPFPSCLSSYERSTVVVVPILYSDLS